MSETWEARMARRVGAAIEFFEGAAAIAAWFAGAAAAALAVILAGWYLVDPTGAARAWGAVPLWFGLD